MFPSIKYVVDKFRHKLPKDELKRHAKEVAKKLVNSDFKNNRVEDPTQISEKQQKKVKNFCKEYFDKAVVKQREREKKKEDQGDDNSSNDDGALDAEMSATVDINGKTDDGYGFGGKSSSSTADGGVERSNGGSNYLKRKREKQDEDDANDDDDDDQIRRHPPPPPPANHNNDDAESMFWDSLPAPPLPALYGQNGSADDGFQQEEDDDATNHFSSQPATAVPTWN